MKLLRRHLRRLSGRSKPFRPLPEMEDVYRHLFVRDLQELGESNIFHSDGDVANYSLLYLIQRIANEFRPRKVLDVGAGQTTLLWDVLHRHARIGEVTTLEHDPHWAEMISARIGHEMLVTPLRPIRLGSVQTNSYDWTVVMQRGPFDAVVCDGPVGSPRFSRYGILSVLDERTPDDFVLILDDVDRAGEQDSVGAIHDRLRRLGRIYSAGVVRAATCQAVFATGRYVPICQA